MPSPPPNLDMPLNVKTGEMSRNKSGLQEFPNSGFRYYNLPSVRSEKES